MSEKRRKEIEGMHLSYTRKIADIIDDDLRISPPDQIVDKTIAFLLAMENMKLSMMESMRSIGAELKAEKMLDAYAKAKKAAMEANRGRIEAQVETYRMNQKKANDAMYR
jgi:hypothetical protein